MSLSAEHSVLQHRFTVKEFHRMGEFGILREDDRVELIDGEIVDMTPIGSQHASVVARLTRILDRAVGDSAIVWPQNPIILAERSEPEPDLALLRPREDYYSRSHPKAADILLTIEVADTSLRYDREEKIPLYARHGIPEAWLVDLTEQELTAYCKPLEEGYAEAVAMHSLVSVPLPGLAGVRVDLSVIFQSKR